MIRRCEESGRLQTTQSKNTAQRDFLCPWLMKTPNVWDWETQKSPICDNIGYRIADKKSVDVHGTGRVRRLIPLENLWFSAFPSEDSLA